MDRPRRLEIEQMMQTAIATDKLAEQQTEKQTVQLLMDGSFIEKAAECVRHAKKQIFICAYAWRWYENSPEKAIQKFNYEIARRSLQGLDIRAILDQRSQAQYLSQYGIKTKSYPTDRAMHTKAMLVDEETLILGSHNLTDRGTAENYELSLLTQDPQACLLFSEYFEIMWRNYAEK